MRNSGKWWNRALPREESWPTVPLFGSGCAGFGLDRHVPETRSAGPRVGAEGYGRGGRE